MAQDLLTVSDFTSLLELGFTINVAATYVSVFVSPLLDRSNREISKFRWLLDNPERASKLIGQGATPEDLEDKFVEWERRLNNLERSAEKVREKPILYCICAAISCFALLFFPWLHVDAVGIFLIGGLAVLPSLLGALFVWKVTRHDRALERKAASRAKALIG